MKALCLSGLCPRAGARAGTRAGAREKEREGTPVRESREERSSRLNTITVQLWSSATFSKA